MKKAYIIIFLIFTIKITLLAHDPEMAKKAIEILSILYGVGLGFISVIVLQSIANENYNINMLRFGIICFLFSQISHIIVQVLIKLYSYIFKQYTYYNNIELWTIIILFHAFIITGSILGYKFYINKYINKNNEEEEL